MFDGHAKPRTSESSLKNNQAHFKAGGRLHGAALSPGHLFCKTVEAAYPRIGSRLSL